MNPDLPIGIFDSGVGGLTVYRALHDKLPHERFVYLGDTARVPYGTKSLHTIERYAIENARFLEARGIKLLVVACNTASALALPALRRRVNVKIVGMIESGACAAVEASAEKRIGVIATESTIQSKAYSHAIAKLCPRARVVERACPLFVSLAEEGWAETDVARQVAAEYLHDLVDSKMDTLVLGCTHYPILRRVIQDAMGAHVRLIDSGEAAAEDVAQLLQHSKPTRAEPSNMNSVRATPRELCDDLDHFYVTDAAERFSRVAERFLGSAPKILEAVEVWGTDELHTHG